MFKNLVIKDAFRQIVGRVASAIAGLIVIKIITPYLGPLRFGDYSTILKYFAIWSAFADFGIYVIALKQLGVIKNNESNQQLATTYSKFVTTRFFMVTIVYTLALVVAYLIPAYTANPYLVRGLPLGMLFSASFMSAGIVQIPIQLFWKMEQLSIGLVLARVAQIALLIVGVYIIYPGINFEDTLIHHTAFNLIISSVLISGLVQLGYVRRQSNNYLKFSRQRDRSFTKQILTTNWKYGLAYYLSSFHTLAVLILLSIFYPTIAGYGYVGTRALALSLIEILLVIPSALGNSLIHKISDSTKQQKLQSFGNLMTFVVRIGSIIVLNCTIFAPHIIYFIGGSEFLSSDAQWGSDTLLPFLAIILARSFIKQVFNYIFVSTDLQNKLLGINLFGVIVGALIGIPLIIHYQLLGGIIAQAIFELLFVGGAIAVAVRHQVIPTINWKYIGGILGSLGVFLYLGTTYIHIGFDQLLIRASIAIVISCIATALSWKMLRTVMRGL